MSPVNTEFVVCQQMTESMRVLNIILAVLVGAVLALAALAAWAVYLVMP